MVMTYILAESKDRFLSWSQYKMKAVILAGGLGTRISEETSIRPKPTTIFGANKA